MKRFIALCIIMIVLGLCCTSCRNFMYSHNVNTVADGKVFRIGTPEINLLFVKGTVMTTIARENTKAKFTSKSKDNVNMPDGEFKGLVSASFQTGPQISGYLRDISKHDSETACKYIEVMPELVGDQKQTKPKEK